MRQLRNEYVFCTSSFRPATHILPSSYPPRASPNTALQPPLAAEEGTSLPSLTVPSLLDTVFFLHDHSCNPLLSKYDLITEL